ncbi:mitochondrial F1F0 ATP synthase-like protein subunit Atp18 [Amylocarpus encephaloides]|uniref:Mitochondrial F1F0 ATP synthase-like protein subunit Atp18 n=1 Tax=Amylocarpus encephaloides TaxID=45428 RepID=A0A9P7YKJ9_9HELO|nr:mitochondrial F1F0 ATP synthase-like protein subunit Atp18 [Amylocarpus encephaloides]
MSFLGKKFPAPVAKPFAPFLVAGLVVMYGVNSFQTMMMNSEEFKNDPRNPNAKTVKPADKH